MRRREFITLAGGAAAAWPLVARAQQQTMPVIGILGAISPEGQQDLLAAFMEGLKETGYVEGRNVTIEYRMAGGQYNRLPALAADLVTLKVTVIFATFGDASVSLAKATTSTIPIVFTAGGDPIRMGVVTSLNRPSGNITGVTFFAHELTPKRLQLLRELIPKVGTVAVLANPSNPNAALDTEDMVAAARALELQTHVLRARTSSELDSAFATLVGSPADALLVGADAFFQSQRSQIVSLAAEHAIPAIYPRLEYVAAGGLISYAPRAADTYHQGGIYVGRILKGEKPADLPIVQPTKIALSINMKTAKALGLEVPPTLLTLADEVIE